MPSRKLVSDPEHWRFRAEEARTVADQMTHEEARTIMRRIALDYDRLAKACGGATRRSRKRSDWTKRHLAFFGQPAKREVAHTSLRLFPIKIRQPGKPGGDTWHQNQ